MKRRIQQSAKNKVLEYLASRDHSEKELREKLSRKFEKAEVDEAIEAARASNLLLEPHELAKRVAGQLARKKKSHTYIQRFLNKKGLPPVARETENEIEKARELVLTKFKKAGPFSYEEKPKVHRYLAYRGFDQDTIRRVIHEGQ